MFIAEGTSDRETDIKFEQSNFAISVAITKGLQIYCLSFKFWPFTGRAVDIILLYIRSNSNTRVPLAVTKTLKLESPDFSCQDDG